MTEINRHKGGCCWFLKDGKYRCALEGCNKVMEKPD
jgi:hypothetical protein